MAEASTEDKAKFWGIFITIVLVIAFAIAAVVSWYKTTKQNVNTGEQAAGDKKTADALASSLGIDPGRGLAVVNAARAIFNEMSKSKVYISSSLCVGALNVAQTDDEMVAMETAYNGQVSNSQRNLKADVDGHVIGWGTSAGDINHYTALT